LRIAAIFERVNEARIHFEVGINAVRCFAPHESLLFSSPPVSGSSKLYAPSRKISEYVNHFDSSCLDAHSHISCPS
jgi:hypothetical protein